jgi:hypothetical protein
MIIKEKLNMKWEISVSNTEFSLWLLHKGNILNIKKKNMINNEGFGRKEKIFNQMNTIIKIKDFLRNLINIIKNMITRNLIKRKQTVLNVENMVILLMTAKLNKRLTNFK